MTAINITDLNNAKLDVDHIAAIATSTLPTATDRIGNVKSTIQGAVDSIDASVSEVEARKDTALAVDIPNAIATVATITDRGVWATATLYSIKDILLVSGTWHVCVQKHTSGATFAGDAAYWRVYQGEIYLPAGTGAVATTIQAKLRESVSVQDFGAVSGNSLSSADSLPDSYPAFAAMLDFCQSSFYNGEIEIGLGYYRLSQPLDIPISLTLVGKGSGESYIHADHLLGPAIRFRAGSSGLRNLGVTASVSRRAGAYGAGNNFGILFEGNDVPENDPGAPRLLHCLLENFYLFGHPEGAVHIVGPAFTGRIVAPNINNTKGHGISFDRGEATGRVNLITGVIGGITGIIEGRISNCGGHAIATGSPTSAFSTPALRVVIDNIEGAVNATDAAVRFYNTPVYLRGANHVYQNSALAVNAGGSGVVVAGRNIHLRNLRCLGEYSNVVHVISYDELPTDGVYIDGMSIINPLAPLDPAILVTRPVGETLEPSNIHIRFGEISNITRVIATDSSMGNEDHRRVGGVTINGEKPVVYKRTNTVINNSSSFASDPDLNSWLKPNELVQFVAVLEYDGSSTSDLRVRVAGPGGSVIRYATEGSLQVGSGDTVLVRSVQAASSTVSLGAGSVGSSRLATIRGFVQNGSTAGYFGVSWAQLVAEPTDTTVFAGVSHLKINTVHK